MILTSKSITPNGKTIDLKNNIYNIYRGSVFEDLNSLFELLYLVEIFKSHDCHHTELN